MPKAPVAKKKSTEGQVIAENRPARHEYEIVETVEAGIALTGSEIKSVRAGRVNLRGTYAGMEKGELWLLNVHIAPYQPASHFGHEPTRPRKLLLHREQIARLASLVQAKGFTLVPLRMYIRNNVAKVELALARGRKVYDKRDAMAKREAEREIERSLKRSNE